MLQKHPKPIPETLWQKIPGSRRKEHEKRQATATERREECAQAEPRIKNGARETGSRKAAEKTDITRGYRKTEEKNEHEKPAETEHEKR